MSKTKITLLLGSLFFIIGVLGVAFYAESSNIRSQELAIQKIVQSDLQIAETLLNSSSEMSKWASYLNIADFRSTLGDESSNAQIKQMILLSKLTNAYGIEKYPALCTLRESISAMRAMKKATAFQTFFQESSFAEQFLAARQKSTISSPTYSIMKTAKAMRLESVSESEEKFYAKSVAELPFPTTDIYAQNFPKIETPAKNTIKTALPLTRRSPLAMATKRFVQKPEIEKQTISMARGNVEIPKNNSLAQSSEITVDAEFLQNTKNIVSATMNNPVGEPQEEDACLPAQMPTSTPTKPNPAQRQAEKNVIPDITAVAEAPQSETLKQKLDSKLEENEIIATDGNFGANLLPTLPTLHFSLEELVKQEVAVISASDSTATSEIVSKSDPISLCGDFSQDIQAIWKAWKNTAYQIPMEADLEAAYTEVRESGRRIDQLLARATDKKSKEWREFLLWDTLNFNEPADSFALKEVYNRLCCGAFGLELEIFVQMREAIAHYHALEVQLQMTQAAEELYKSARLRMLALLTLAQKKNTSEIQRAIEDLAEWFVKMGQVSEPLLATYQVWSKPNMTAHVSSSVFERFGSQFIEEERDVREQLQRATIRGKALFSGNLSVEPIVNENQIELGIFLEGGIDSKTRAYQGPAIVSSRARSRVEVQKSIFLDDTGFNTTAAKVKVRTNSQIENIQDIHNRRLLESFITHRVFAKKSETEQLANAQSTLHMRQRFDEMLDPILDDWNQRFTDLFERQFAPRGLVSESTRTWSDDCGIHACASMMCREGLAAPSVAPQFPQVCDVQLTIHESAFQQIAKAFLGGMNLNACAREQFAKSIPDWLKPKKKLENVEESQNEKNTPQDWTLRFPHSWPISASFEDGKITFCMHCEKMVYDGKEYPALNIIVVYAIETCDQRITLVRQGNVEIFPPDFNPAEKKRLPSSMVSLRRVMSKRLQKIFMKEIVLKARPVVKDSKNSQSRFANLYIQPVVVHAENGWLQLGFNLENRQSPCPPVQ